MTGIAITANDADDRELLTTVMKALLTSVRNITELENDQRNGNSLGESPDLSALFEIEDREDIDFKKVEKIISNMEIAEEWQHDDWEPGEPCPKCGSEDITVMSPREYEIEKFDGHVVHGAPDDMVGPDLDHWCKGCDSLLSEHPASALFSVC